jgi:hypothetical protein
MLVHNSVENYGVNWGMTVDERVQSGQNLGNG